MPPADPTPPADDFPAGQTGDMRNVLLSPPTGPKTPAGRWEPPSAQELAAMLPQYEIESMLGRGGMGAVYQGRQIALDRPVAIKILSNQLEDADASFTERFKNEARAMAKLSHPGIVGVYDFGEAEVGRFVLEAPSGERRAEDSPPYPKLLYIVMEFIEGTDVAKMLSQQKRLHTEHAMAITAHVCDALAYAHERGIIHRDIKPANIMVGYDGVVKVADFGLAKMTHSQNSGLTQSGMAMGTLHYMAPEALMLGSAVDHRADIYAVGVMLYQMLTGKIPQGLFELPSLQVPGLDPRYDGIIGKALREDRELRYPTVLDMRHDLDAILTQPVVKVEPSAEKAPAALQTQARPQRPGGQPYRPPQPEVIVRTEKKGSPLLWVGFIAMACLAGWLVLKDSRKVGEASPDAPVSAAPGAVPVSNKQVAAGGPTARTTNPAEATKDSPFVNSLGMKFVPVPGSNVLFCIHETRQKDFEAYAAQAQITRGAWRDQSVEGVAPNENPLDHPVLRISWEDAQGFCAWLSKKEGKIYRLPTDREWSIAVGLGSKEVWTKDTTPEELHHKVIDEWPWGSKWPPIQNAGNYSDISRKLKAPAKYIENFDDGFPGVAPVMSFEPNSFGIYDMGGNAWEWCEDWYNAEKMTRVLRGGSWPNFDRTHLLSSTRDHRAPNLDGHDGYGFRCVLEVANQPALTTMPPVVPQAIPQPTQAAQMPAPDAKSETSPVPARQSGDKIDLMALIKTTGGVSKGVWKEAPNGLENLQGHLSSMGAKCDLPEEFDFEIEFSLTGDSTGGIFQMLRIGDSPIVWAMHTQSQFKAPLYGFEYLDGQNVTTQNEAGAHFKLRFAKGLIHRSVVEVRKGSLRGVVDGQEVIHWRGDTSRFSEKIRRLESPANAGFGTYNGGTVFHKAVIVPFFPKPAPPIGPTTWTDTKGRSITATFKAIASGNALLDIAGKVTPVPLNTLSAESQKLARAYHDQSSAAAANDPAKVAPFTNSLGMKFVPVPGTKVLFCIHETRRKDYAVFASGEPRSDATWRNPKTYNGILMPTDDEQPVSCVCHEDARLFCDWLSKKDGRTYRLPTDREWSHACGIASLEKEATPTARLSMKNAIAQLSMRSTILDKYPWGDYWPPSDADGNFADKAWRDKHPMTTWTIEGLSDGHMTTAPVMSFKPNDLGIYDLGGNLQEACELAIPVPNEGPVVRGGSWFDGLPSDLVSSRRVFVSARDRSASYGFRCVIELP
jgi:serine/threonine protein kinase/formylglycine-generating enzyme required for sulfatase activity